MKRPMETPKRIVLSELPDSGKSFDYTTESGELNEDLADTVGSNAYSIHLFLEKLGNAYQATGSIQSHQDLLCARCGSEIKSPVNLKVREILMVQPELPRSGKTARVNHASELDPMGPDCVFLHKDELNVGDFIREIIVLNEPFQPLCEKPCENPYMATQTVQNEVLGAPKSPFSVLKDFKLNS